MSVFRFECETLRGTGRGLLGATASDHLNYQGVADSLTLLFALEDTIGLDVDRSGDQMDMEFD